MKKDKIILLVLSVFTALFFTFFVLGSFGILFGSLYFLMMKLCFCGVGLCIFTLLMMKYPLVRIIVKWILLIIFGMSFFLFIAIFVIGMICGDITSFTQFMQVDFFVILGSIIVLSIYWKFGALDLSTFYCIKDFFIDE